MRSFFIVFLLVAFGVQAQETAMTSSEISVFTEGVKSEAKNTKSITSDFVQYKHLDFLSNDIETSGKMIFKAPNLIKWQYTAPYNYSVVFKDDKLLINDGGTKNTVDIGSSKMFKKMNVLIVNSVKGNMFDDDVFEISYFKTATNNKAVFIPKDKNLAEFISRFELLFNKKDNQVEEVKLIEPSYDFTRILFKNRILNPTVADAVFSN